MIDHPDPNGLKRLERRSLSQEAYAQLKAGILSRTLPGGTRLTELGLARQFATSQAPIREALRQLAKDGLVVQQPDKGSYVAQVNRSELRDIYLLRGLLEEMAIRRVILLQEAQRTTLVERLRVHVRAMETAEHHHDHAALSENDIQFHEAILTATDSPTMIACWNLVHSQTRLAMAEFTVRVKQGIIAPTAVLHAPIVDAIASGNARAAVQAMQRHMKVAQARIAELINLLPPPHGDDRKANDG
jgi:DNA-binding GntR family transcriptional regulator